VVAAQPTTCVDLVAELEHGAQELLLLDAPVRARVGAEVGLHERLRVRVGERHGAVEREQAAQPLVEARVPFVIGTPIPRHTRYIHEPSRHVTCRGERRQRRRSATAVGGSLDRRDVLTHSSIVSTSSWFASSYVRVDCHHFSSSAPTRGSSRIASRARSASSE
jgi:hypothetical protein